MKRIAILLLLVCSAVTSAYAADAPSKKKKAPATPTAPQPVIEIPKVIEKPWVPEPFPQRVERLPEGYSGVNPEKFFAMFRDRVNSIKKGEFETTAEHAARTVDKENIFSPINFRQLYAFRLYSDDEILFTYNADSQSYMIESKDALFLHTSEYDESLPSGIAYFDIHANLIEQGQYAASTAGGGSTIVKKQLCLIKRLSFEVGKPFGHSGLFFPHSKYPASFGYRDSITIPLTKARELKGKKLAMLFIGRVDKGELYSKNTHIPATFSSPAERTFESEFLPFEIKKIVYYVVETGEILGSKDF